MTNDQKPSSANEPREYWIVDDFTEVKFTDGKTCGLAFDKEPDEPAIKVVEFAAVERLREELTEAA